VSSVTTQYRYLKSPHRILALGVLLCCSLQLLAQGVVERTEQDRPSSHMQPSVRKYGGHYTRERINNLRNNCLSHAWAKKLKDAAIEKAAPWAVMEDSALWALVPGQDLPRCIDVTFDRLTTGPKSLGCLKCGDEIRRFGNYPYTPDFKNKPWKLTCPSCHSVFPTNDFAKYYASAIDERGLFNPEKGDKRLLYNENHPDTDDPLHKYGVDDGYGYIDENGRAHRFIGYYVWKYWMHLNDGLAALADAFLYTGEQRYAHKAAILLDRIADVYPDMDWKPYADRGWYHSDGGSNMGKIEGSIWETGVVQKFADSYDKILSGTVNAPALFEFLQQQSERYQLPNPKGTRSLFVQNVDQRILHTAFEAVLNEQIRGNQGMHQLTVAMCAIALNTAPKTNEWLDWLFLPEGGAIPGLMVSKFDRDGTSDEGAPGYSLIWGRHIAQLAFRLNNYSAYTRYDIFKDYPQFAATFLAAYRLAALGFAIPNIGASGATGLISDKLVDPNYMALGYYHTRNPEIAIAAYRANGNIAEGLGRDIYSGDPDSLAREIQAIAESAGPRPEGGYLMSGFGMALLESGRGKSGTALVSHYGRTMKHGHRDMLNFDLLAFGKWLTPDHGYPEFATKWPSNLEWTSSTISHNTVYVNRKPQGAVWSGNTKLFKQLKGFGVFELDGRKAYPDIKQYTRTMFLLGGDGALSGDSNAYVFDIFQVSGGADHVYSFHGPPGEITHHGLLLTAQDSGTYAGKNVAKGEWATDFPIGYSHLYNVRTAVQPPSQFMLDWKAAPGYRGLSENDDIHLRLHALTLLDDVALADGDPPQNKPGNPVRLGYALLHRAGNDLNSTFVSVIEPYRERPFIKAVRRLDDPSTGVVAIRVDRMNGAIDYLLYNKTPDKTARLANGISLAGRAAFIQEMNGEVRKAILINGSKLKYKNLNLSSSGTLTGKVVKMNKELTGGGWLIVDKKLPADGSLTGHQIMIQTSTDRDACYTIRKIEPEGKGSKIFCGPIAFVRGFKGGETVIRRQLVPKDYTQGYLYDFEEGDAFEISVYQEWNADAPR
jgi:hypothetical protein